MDSRKKELPLWQVLVVLLGAPALYVLMFVISGVSFATFSRYAFIAGMVTEYIFLGIVVWFLRQTGKRLADIGLVMDQWRREALLGLGLGVVLFMLSGIMITTVERFLPSAISREPRPLWASLLFGFGVVTAFAPIEEIIWRGYAVTFLRQHLNTWVAVIIASVTFGLMHWWGGIALMVEASIVGILLSGLYLWRGNLVANIVCHFVSDFPLFLFMLFAA
ncbi:MAG: lysostaphin resistance A-like protein [Anaerolineae bacterium]